MFKLTRIAIACALALPVFAHAESNADLVKEIEALKARLQQLEEQVQQQQQQAVDPDQFNRISTKAEALEDQRDANGFKNLKVNGFIDPVYLYNRAQNAAGFAFLNGFQTDSGASNPLNNGDAYAYDNSYFGMAVLDIQKEMDGGTKWRLTLAPEKSSASIYNFGSIVHEASASVPLDSPQNRLLVGQIPDWSGYEYSFGNQNKLITHNLLFDFTVPAFYTGVGLDLVRGPWEFKTLVANVNAPKYAPKDGTSAYSTKTPMWTGRFDYTKEEFWGFGGAAQLGQALNYRTGTSTSSIAMAEIDAYYTRGVWGFNGQLAVGRQKDAAVNGGDASWWGLSTLASYNFTPRLAGIARFDYLYDEKNGGGLFTYTVSDGRNGIGPGFVYDSGSGTWVVGDPNKGANKYALSLGLNYLFNEFTTFKAEYRYDRASEAVFRYLSDGSYRKDNQVFGLSTVVSF